MEEYGNALLVPAIYTPPYPPFTLHASLSLSLSLSPLLSALSLSPCKKTRRQRRNHGREGDLSLSLFLNLQDNLGYVFYNYMFVFHGTGIAMFVEITGMPFFKKYK